MGAHHGRRGRAGADRRPAGRAAPEGRAARTRSSASRGRCASARSSCRAPIQTRFDTCGTGGDGAGTFNISSVAALVVAACGVPVAKHGNRSVSSRCGSADVFEALGVNVAAAPAIVERCLAEAGIAFFFAPTFHPSMRHAAPVRRDLGVRTAFNLLGPLTNPAGAPRQIVGVPRPELTELVARALALLGSERAWVVHGADGLDEMSTTGYTKVSECRDGHGAHVLRASGRLRPARRRRRTTCGAATRRTTPASSGRCCGRARPGARRRAAQRRRGAVRRRRATASIGEGLAARRRRRSTAAPRGDRAGARWSRVTHAAEGSPA